jgi:hypothetical protein
VAATEGGGTVSVRISKGVALALVVAFYGLSLLGALGNRNWFLLAWLGVPLAYIAGSELVRRRTRPAAVRADRHGGR